MPAAARSMDFFGLQDRARRRTGLLLALYASAVAAIIGAIYVVLAAVFAGGTSSESAGQLWDPVLFGWVAAGVLTVVGLGAAVRGATLSHGGEAVARMLGGRPIEAGSADPAERRVLNVVEEMALASGLPVPRVFVLDGEPAINAFAAGFGPRDAVVGVTRGCIEQLSRDELQGVIAHEFSHILYGDMRLNIRLMGVLYGILVIAMIGRGLMRAAAHGARVRRRDNKSNPLPLLLIGLALWLIGWIGVFFANLIKAAISRQREFLADAAGVQFTRNPSGLAGALRKIAAAANGSRLRADQAAEASHLFFGNALQEAWLGLFATHPPIAQRIARLEPGTVVSGPPEIPRPPPVPTTAASTVTTAEGGAAMFAAAAVETAGTFGPAHLDLAHAMLADLPEAIRDAVRHGVGARAVVYGLLLDRRDAAVRAKQWEAIAADPPAAGLLRALEPSVAALSLMARLPLVDLAVPALRGMEPDERAVFHRVLDELAGADRRADLFEYALGRLARRHVSAAVGRADAAAIRYRHIGAVMPAIRTLLGALAWAGSDDAAAAERAWTAALHALGAEGGVLPRSVSLSDVDSALTALAAASMEIRRAVVAACAACVAEDGELRAAEYELLRAVADSLDCPMPPLAPAESATAPR